jgi:DNA-binding NtrC family response regulator
MTGQTSGKNNVLLVDDEVDVLKSYELTLKSRQIHNIITCQDSREVLPIMERKPVDVIVLDLMMPGISGEELLEVLTERFPDVPVIIVTAVNDVEIAVRCLNRGAKDYMLKPVERNRFVSGIKRLLEMRQLQRENQSLKQHLLSNLLEYPRAFSHIVTQNHSMLSIFKYIETVAESHEPVLITGETGVGKELVARAIHDLSRRQARFVSVNVAGLDDNVFSDTLFGHIKGAFTDAHQPRSGLVEEAKGGTLFLDEIGDLNPSSQIKLLRLLQEKEYYQLGSDNIKRSNCRVVCSTNRQLEERIENGTFRNDLYYRLRTHQVHIPPLRERLDDLPLLVDHFLAEAFASMKPHGMGDLYAAQTGGVGFHSFPGEGAASWGTAMKKKEINPSLAKDIFKIICNYHFPGNVRELRSLVFDAAATGSTDTLALEKIKQSVKTTIPSGPSPGIAREHPAEVELDLSGYSRLPTLMELEAMALREAMKRSNGNMSQAAKLLGIHRQTMAKKLARIKI